MNITEIESTGPFPGRPPSFGRSLQKLSPRPPLLSALFFALSAVALCPLSIVGNTCVHVSSPPKGVITGGIQSAPIRGAHSQWPQVETAAFPSHRSSRLKEDPQPDQKGRKGLVRFVAPGGTSATYHVAPSGGGGAAITRRESPYTGGRESTTKQVSNAAMFLLHETRLYTYKAYRRKQKTRQNVKNNEK